MKKYIGFVSSLQVIIAILVSQYQTVTINRYAKQTKYIRLAFALFVFVISLGQTYVILEKLNKTKTQIRA